MIFATKFGIFMLIVSNYELRIMCAFFEDVSENTRTPGKMLCFVNVVLSEFVCCFVFEFWCVMRLISCQHWFDVLNMPDCMHYATVVSSIYSK